jgi:secreted trypsin-like serine protease
MKTKLTSLLLIHCLATAALVQRKRVVGGTTTTSGAYPYMTALVEKGATPSNGQFCGAALVAPQWVLTAGHCMEGTPASAIDVWIGGRDLRNEAEGVRVAVSQVIMHPNYGENAQGALQYDFCLLKLARAVTERTTLPLVETAAQVAPGITSRAIGWGATAEGGSGSNVLLQVDLSIVSLSIAGQTIPGLNSAHLAAGRASGGIDTCQGDSGGPLMVRNSAGLWSHGGTVSFGNGCARPGEYGIYGNTITVKPWITGYIGGVTTPVDDHANTIATASNLAPNGTATGNLETAGDVDVLKVTVASAGTLTINSTGGTDVIGTLLNASGATLSTNDDGAGAPNFRLGTAVTSAATFYVRVSGKTSTTTGAYGLSATLTSTPVAVGDIAVRDGSTNVPLNGSIAYGSRVVNSAALNKTITLANTGNGTLAINGATLSGSGSFSLVSQPATRVNAGGTTSFIIAFRPTSAGALQSTLTITSNDPNENPYRITLTGTGQASATDDYGNTIATATRVTLPVSLPGVISSGTDRDFFTFTLPASKTVTLRTLGSPDTYGILYNSSGRIITQADDSTDYDFVITRSLAAGTYYLRVEGYSTANVGPYTVSIQ